jgi:hypothetical protein
LNLRKLKKAQQTPFETLAQGYFCGYRHQSLIPIRTQSTLEVVWEKFRSGVINIKEPPVVDFRMDMLIFALRGLFPSRGYATVIKRLVEAEDRIGNTFLWVVVYNVNPSSMVEQTVSQPWCLIKTRTTQRPIRGFFVGQ